MGRLCCEVYLIFLQTVTIIPLNPTQHFTFIYLRNIPFYVRYIKLHRSDITTESNSSLYCSQRCIMWAWLSAFSLPEISANNRAIIPPSSEECLAVCRERHTPNSASTIWMTLQLDVPLLWVQQQHHNTHSGQNSNIIQMFTRNQITKQAPTIEAVSRMHRRPSRPTEASHKWWGDKTREAGPRGWPLTSCSGFSWTTCWLETPSWAEESGSRIMISDVLIDRLRTHTWDHCFYKQ